MKKAGLALLAIILSFAISPSLRSMANGFYDGAVKGWDCYSCNSIDKENTGSASEKPAAQSDSANKPTYSPAAWQLEYQGTTSYLFGSIHVGDASMYPLPKAISGAFDKADTLVVEADINNIDQAKMAVSMQKLAFSQEHPLKTVLSEETNAKYDQYCEKTRSPCAMFQFVDPWFAAMNLEVMAFMRAGYSAELGIDMHFLNLAAKQEKEIAELESMDMQLKMLDEMPANLQELMLLGATIKDQDDIHMFMQAWKTGTLEAAMQQAEQESLELGIKPQDLEQLNELFLFERNRGMADGIEKLLKQGKSLFVVVGAAHYTGEKSVISYLQEKGFTIKAL